MIFNSSGTKSVFLKSLLDFRLIVMGSPLHKTNKGVYLDTSFFRNGASKRLKGTFNPAPCSGTFYHFSNPEVLKFEGYRGYTCKYKHLNTSFSIVIL